MTSDGEYKPVEIRNAEAGYVEFVAFDVPFIVREIGSRDVAILLDMETRNVIGYRVYDPVAPWDGEVVYRQPEKQSHATQNDEGER